MQWCQVCVRIGKSVWLMGLTLRDGWKFASTTHGEQSVMTIGTLMTLELSADSLDTQLNVSSYVGKEVAE